MNNKNNRWQAIPNFGDPFAKVNTTIHEASGAKIVEVLYGAKDEQGKATYPGAENDGHGRWVAIETDGMYQVISWTRPNADKSNEEESADVLKDIEEAIAQKEALLAKAKEIKENADLKDLNAAFNDLYQEWRNVPHYRTPKENELYNEYQATRSSCFESAVNVNKESKEKIIAEAKAIVENQDWANGQAKLEALMEEWKQCRYAGKAEDERLWNEFKAARSNFYATRKAHFANLYSEHAEKKAALIAKAKEISANVTNYKQTAETMDGLMNEWKETGSAGKQKDDALWNEFIEIRNAFYQAKKAYHETQSKLITTASSAKKALISAVKEIAEGKDYSKKATDKMIELQNEWKKTGYAGKENDSLWNEFKAAQDEFWATKKAEQEQKQAEWKARQESRVTNLKQIIEKETNQVATLKDRLTNTFNEAKVEQINGWIAEHEAKIADITKTVEDILSKLNK